MEWQICHPPGLGSERASLKVIDDAKRTKMAQISQGRLCSGYLGCYALALHNGRGYVAT